MKFALFFGRSIYLVSSRCLCNLYGEFNLIADKELRCLMGSFVSCGLFDLVGFRSCTPDELYGECYCAGCVYCSFYRDGHGQCTKFGGFYIRDVKMSVCEYWFG